MLFKLESEMDGESKADMKAKRKMERKRRKTTRERKERNLGTFFWGGVSVFVVDLSEKKG